MRPYLSVETDGQWLFRLPNGRHEFEEEIEGKAEEETPDDENRILCRQCLQVITSPAESTEVQGAHEHTFVNPSGILYQIGCFRSGKGCTHLGSATEQWSWFKGFSWRIAVCSACLTHLGWLFISSGGESFHGLILNRLIASGEGSAS